MHQQIFVRIFERPMCQKHVIMMKKLLYILSIFAMLLVFDSCTKEAVHKCDGEYDYFDQDNENDSRGVIDQGGGGAINDQDNDDDDEDEDNDQIGDPDNDDDDEEEDNDEVEEVNDRGEGA